MAATLVQKASNTTTGAASVSVASGNGWASPTSGNLIVAWATCDTTVTTPTGFTAGPSVIDQNAVYLWWKVSAGTETSVSFTLGGSTSPGAFGLMEYSGMAASPGDGTGLTSSIQVTAGTTTTSVSVTGTGTSGDLFVAVAGLGFTVSAFPTGPTWTNSFVNQQSVSAGSTSSAVAQQAFVADFQNTSAAAASTACSWTNQMQNRQELLIAFKLAAAAATQIPTLVMART